MTQNQRIQVDFDLHLTITLADDGEARRAAYNALLADMVESIERLGLRYYLRGEQGESIRATLPAECVVTDLVPPADEGGPGPERGHSAGRTQGAARRETAGTAASGGGARVLRFVRPAKDDQPASANRRRSRRRRGSQGEAAPLVTHSAVSGHPIRGG